MVESIRIRVRDIRPHGVDIAEKLSENIFDLTKENIVRIVSPVEVKARVRKEGDTVHAKADVKALYSISCARCLEPVENNIVKVFKFHFFINASTEFIDLGEEIRQEVILNLPSQVLCKEDCRGICIGCGVDLNKEECKCFKK